MRSADAIAQLAQDLDALSARRRHKVVSALTTDERDQLDRLLATAMTRNPARAAGISPWLAAMIDAAGAFDTATASSPARWTPAAARALARHGAPASTAPVPIPSRAAGRSLLGAVGGLLSARTAS